MPTLDSQVGAFPDLAFPDFVYPDEAIPVIGEVAAEVLGWVFYNTHDGVGAHRRQEGGFVEQISPEIGGLLQRITEYETQREALGISVSPEWGQLYDGVHRRSFLRLP